MFTTMTSRKLERPTEKEEGKVHSSHEAKEMNEKKTEIKGEDSQ